MFSSSITHTPLIRIFHKDILDLLAVEDPETVPIHGIDLSVITATRDS